MSRPVLSVLIDTYNHEKYIEQAVVSAIEQNFPASDYEIVVVDDGSTDRTPEVVRKFAPRVRLLRKKNGGQASAFNAAIPELRGEIVAFLDGDDWFAPGKLTAVVNALERHPEVAAVTHGWYSVTEGTSEVKTYRPRGEECFNLQSREAARAAAYGWNHAMMGALTVRRNILGRVLPIPEELVFCGDGPIAMAAMAGGLCLFPDLLFNYRQHKQGFHLADPNDRASHLKMLTRIDRVFEIMEATLIQLGVDPKCAAALLNADWKDFNRVRLRMHGGSRMSALRTELRALEAEVPSASASYRLFKYVVVGGATLLLPPRLFYRARDWYGQRNLGRVRELVFKKG